MITIETSEVEVITDYPVAVDSVDHTHPKGTMRDNSANLAFNKKLHRLFGIERCLKVLDLGCSGGGFVRSLIDQGDFAVGIDGSDYSKIHRRAEWRTIPEYLFTADISKPFQVRHNDCFVQFDVVTAWEVLEHLDFVGLQSLLQVVHAHLRNGGLFIVSVSLEGDLSNGVQYHQTVNDVHWWTGLFQARGFDYRTDYVKYFNRQFVRGYNKWIEPSVPLVFSVGHNTPTIPKETLAQRLFDRWCSSLAFRFLSGKQAI